LRVETGKLLPIQMPIQAEFAGTIAKNSGSTFNLILNNETNAKDADISVKLKAIAGGEDQGGGLVWRAKGLKQLLHRSLQPFGRQLRVYKW